MGTTLSGRFTNCYGLQDFELSPINFDDTHNRFPNRAIIYAPNGVMKTSLARVFEDISKGQPTVDRIFKDLSSAYEITYGASTYSNTHLSPMDEVYVINSFDDTFQCRSNSIPLLLADPDVRRTYEEIYSKFVDVLERFQNNLAKLSGVSKANIRERIISDFQLSTKSDWMHIFDVIGNDLGAFLDSDLYSGFKYSDVFNDKTAKIFEDPTFMQAIKEYVTRLNELISNSTLLSNDFDDRNADLLGKSLKANNLFKAHHSIRLKDDTPIQNLDDWNSLVSSEVKKLYGSTTLAPALENLEKLLTATAESQRLRQIIRDRPEIVGELGDVPGFKKKMWLHWVSRLEEPFDAAMGSIMEYQDEIRDVKEQASSEKERWLGVIDEFNQRFRVPFRVEIDNQSGVILSDEAPKVHFLYKRIREGDEGPEVASYDDRNELMKVLSTGEMRALYLLYVLFDLKNIVSSANEDQKRHLIIADDIADSFDYKNKYAIMQYLEDVAVVKNIDLLLLTHNFDFYRTAASRLCIGDSNCYVAQRDQAGIVHMSQFGRQQDYFKESIRRKILDGAIGCDDEKKKCLIASIPFYRNLADYSGKTKVRDYLTHLLHVKHDSSAMRTATKLR
jgi:hypothetical protein